MKYVKAIVVFVIGFTLGLFMSNESDPNSELVYGDTGFPKNCRAIIHENIVGHRSGEFTAEAVLGSIERNCGENGYSW
jgi:hypothetical protein